MWNLIVSVPDHCLFIYFYEHFVSFWLKCKSENKFNPVVVFQALLYKHWKDKLNV